MKKPLIHRLVAFSIRHSLAVICLTLALSAFFGYFALQIQMSPDVETLLPEDEQVGSLMKKYGGGKLVGEFLVVAVQSQDLFRLDTLSAFGEMIERIESLPEIQPGITPFNLLAFEKEGRQVRPVPLSPGRCAPGSEEELRLFEKRILSSPVARNLVISADGTTLVAVFTCEKTYDYAGLMSRVREIASQYEERLHVVLSGSVPFLERTGVYLKRDLSTLLAVAALIILVSYYLGFRAVRGVALPFLVVALGTVWCLGFMSLAGFALTVVTIVIPPLVLTLGSSYSIHILNQYFREAGGGRQDHLWIADSVFHVNRTILMAAATTIAGLLSLLTVSLRQIWHFAIATSFGVASCALLSLFFFPALLSRLKHPAPGRSNRVLKGFLSRQMKRLIRWVSRFRLPIIVAAGALAVTFALTVNRLEFTTDTIGYFPEQDRVVADMHFLTEKIGGFDEINLTLLAPENEGSYFLRSDVLDSVFLLEGALRDNPDISYLTSFVSYLGYLESVLGAGPELPESRAPVLLLARFYRTLASAEGRQRYLRIMANEDFSRLTLSMRIYNSRTGKFIDEAGMREILEYIDHSVNRMLVPEIEHAVWGTGLRYLAAADMVRKDLLRSVLASLVAVFLMAVLAFRSLRYGLYTLVPLLCGLMVNFILMVFFAIPLDATTFMVSSLAVGVGVDDAIHLLFQSQTQRRRFPDDPARALGATLSVTGRPILLTTAAIVSGLLVLLFASFKPIVYFAILVTVSLSTTCAATLFLLPAILMFTHRRKGR